MGQPGLGRYPDTRDRQEGSFARQITASAPYRGLLVPAYQ